MTDHPTAPVQDDDAEIVRRLREKAGVLDDETGSKYLFADELSAELLLAAFAIERLSRLSPTPETGLVEALEKIAAFTNGYGDVAAIVNTVARDALREHYEALANASPALSNEEGGE